MIDVNEERRCFARRLLLEELHVGNMHIFLYGVYASEVNNNLRHSGGQL